MEGWIGAGTQKTQEQKSAPESRDFFTRGEHDFTNDFEPHETRVLLKRNAAYRRSVSLTTVNPS